MTIIWYTRCKQLEALEYNKKLSELPSKMKLKNAKYKRWQDAHAHLYGKLLLAAGLKYLEIENTLEELMVSKYGKPYFENQMFNFNISHTEDYVACVISIEEKYNLGIDLEKIKPIEFNQFENIWTAKEKESLVRLKEFYTYWTRKEAVIKADGRGMQIPLNEIDVTELEVKVDDKIYYLKHMIFDEAYEMHLASATKLTHVEMMEYVF
jgi:4'-phosphopantetheinyl transferase